MGLTFVSSVSFVVIQDCFYGAGAVQLPGEPSHLLPAPQPRPDVVKWKHKDS